MHEEQSHDLESVEREPEQVIHCNEILKRSVLSQRLASEVAKALEMWSDVISWEDE